MNEYYTNTLTPEVPQQTRDNAMADFIEKLAVEAKFGSGRFSASFSCSH